MDEGCVSGTKYTKIALELNIPCLSLGENKVIVDLPILGMDNVIYLCSFDRQVFLHALEEKIQEEWLF